MHPNNGDMDIATNLLARIHDHCEATGIAETTFGLRVANDGKVIRRLREGKTVTLKTLQKIEDALANKDFAA